MDDAIRTQEQEVVKYLRSIGAKEQDVKALEGQIPSPGTLRYALTHYLTHLI